IPVRSNGCGGPSAILPTPIHLREDLAAAARVRLLHVKAAAPPARAEDDRLEQPKRRRGERFRKKATVLTRSAARFTRSRFQTTGSCTWPTARTGAFRSSRPRAST